MANDEKVVITLHCEVLDCMEFAQDEKAHVLNQARSIGFHVLMNDEGDRVRRFLCNAHYHEKAGTSDEYRMQYGGHQKLQTAIVPADGGQLVVEPLDESWIVDQLLERHAEMNANKHMIRHEKHRQEQEERERRALEEEAALNEHVSTGIEDTDTNQALSVDISPDDESEQESEKTEPHANEKKPYEAPTVSDSEATPEELQRIMDGEERKG